MKFTPHYSSSLGNFYTLDSNSGCRLLIEAGVPWAKLLGALEYKTRNILGCLITHEHKDHCMAAKELRLAGIPIYATCATFEAMKIPLSEIIASRLLHPIPAGCTFEIGDFKIYPFEIEHDAADPVGYFIHVDGETLLFATDTSHIKARFTDPIDIIAIECSYDDDILADQEAQGILHPTVCKRLLTSHMEWKNTLAYIKKLNLAQCRQIHLLHMSGDRIDKEHVRRTIEQETFIETTYKPKGTL